MSKVCTLTVVNEVFTMVTGLDKTTLNKCINPKRNILYLAVSYTGIIKSGRLGWEQSNGRNIQTYPSRYIIHRNGASGV